MRRITAVLMIFLIIFSVLSGCAATEQPISSAGSEAESGSSVNQDGLNLQISNCDDGSLWKSTSYIRSETGNAPEGTGYVTAKSSSQVVLSYDFPTAVNLSDFQKGWVSLWIYIDNTKNMVTDSDASGRIELYGADGKVCAWDIATIGLPDGWSYVKFNFSFALETCDLTAVTSFRLYQNVKDMTVIGIDDLGLGTKELPEREPINVKFTFDNDVTGEKPESGTYGDGASLSLPECKAQKDGYTFCGYSDGFAVYPAGYKYTLNGDVEFMAEWRANDAAEETLYDSAVRLAIGRSVLFSGSENMRAAIARVLQKIDNGEEVTLVGVGASCLSGCAADPGKESMTLLKNWLSSLNPKAKITLYNAGIGSTEEVFAVGRLYKDALSHQPDLVILDCSENNVGLPYGTEAYEGELTKLISAGIPTINFNCVFQNGNNVQEQILPVSTAYGVPQISLKSSFWELTQQKNIPAGLTAEDLWISDHCHPSNTGHKFSADLIISYLTSVYEAYKAGTLVPAELDRTLPDPVTDNKYQDAVLFESSDGTNPYISVVDATGWTDDYHASIYQLDLNGWQSTTEGASITFRVKGSYFAILTTISPKSGNIDVSVDGAEPKTMSAYAANDRYMFPYNAIHLGTSGVHTVKITLQPNGVTEKVWFGICAVTAANLAN